MDGEELCLSSDDNFFSFTITRIRMNQLKSDCMHAEDLLPFPGLNHEWYERDVIDKMNEIQIAILSAYTQTHTHTFSATHFASQLNARYFTKPQKTLAKVKKMR